ncbi:unnamed protein product [Calicophoron daubneyi]|uniref:Uncharacterized protein n=1 Tax=Calicophoron daubneyi TaxID=300641 RepID=A0AAV2T4A7_CALDB
MGVPGLWRLLEPARRPADLERLAGKVVAIDMNIWLHQAVKSRAAEAGPRSYLAVLFRRLCKLIYFGIRPIFVFDGEVPALKRATMAARRKLRGRLGDRAARAQERLFHRLLKRVAEASLPFSAKVHPHKSVKKSSPGCDDDAKLELLRRLARRPDVQQAQEDAELFKAPPEKNDSDLVSQGLLHENAGLEYDELAHDYLDGFNLQIGSQKSDLDLYSDAFCSLPLRAQMRVVQLARERLDAHSSFMEYSLSLSDDQASNTELISSNQVNRLLLRRRLAQRQDELAVILAREEVAEQLAQMNDSQLRSALHSQIALLRGEGSGTIEELSTTALRIQSRDSGHAILVKKSPMKPSTGISAQRSGSVLTLQSLIQKISGRTAFQEEELEQQTEENENAELKHNHENPSASSDKELVKKPETETQAPVMPTQEEKEITKLECHEVVCQTISEDSDSKRDLVQSAKPQTQEPATGVANKNVSSRITGTDVEPSELKAVPPKIITEAEEKEDIALTHIEPPSESVVDNSPSAFTHTPAKSTVRSELDVKIIENELEEKKGNEPISTGEEAEFIIHDEEEEDDEFIEVPTEELPTSPKPLSDDGTESNTEESEVELEGPHSPTAGTEEHFGVGSLSDEDHFELDDDVLREEADRFSRQAQTTTTRCITEAQELLRLFGAPFLVSPQEAEAQCATLQRLGLVDFVASDDSDVWPFGARTVCRHLFGGGDDRTKSRTAAVHSPSCYSADDIRDTVGLSPANIIRLALLCGSDYTPGIQNVGPVTAVEILSEFGQSGDPAESESLSWLEGVEATDNLVGDIINPLKHFQEWWKSTSMKQEPCPNKDCKTPNASPVRRKWLKLTPPAGFPDPRVVEAYLNPQVTTDLKPFVWEAPNVESLVSCRGQIWLATRDHRTDATSRPEASARTYFGLGPY